MLLTKIETDSAIEFASQGASLKDIAAHLHVSVRALMRLLEIDPIFKKELRQAREVGFTVRAESLRDIVHNNVMGDANHLRVIVDTEKWILGKLHPAVFGDRIAVQVETVDIGGAMQEAKQRALRVINPEQLAIDVVPIIKNPFEE